MEYKKKAKEIEARLVDIRRDIHAHPEIGFEVERTADIVANELHKLGMDVRKKSRYYRCYRYTKR